MGLESLPLSLCSAPTSLPHPLGKGTLNGSTDPYGLAGQQRVSEKMSGRGEAGSSVVAVLKRKRRKRRSTNRRWSSASTFPSGCWHGAAGCPPTHTMITECFDMAWAWPRTGPDWVLLLLWEICHLLCNQNFPEASYGPNLPSGKYF